MVQTMGGLYPDLYGQQLRLYFKLQISCLSSSHGLANRLRFTHYFQVSASDIIFAPGFFGIITKFGWQRVGILTQEEDLFTVVSPWPWVLGQ